MSDTESLALLFVLFSGSLGLVHLGFVVWVAVDSRSRGMDGVPVWVILVLLTSIFGVFVYYLARPSGRLVSCRSCGNARLQAAWSCPHCRAELRRPSRDGD